MIPICKLKARNSFLLEVHFGLNAPHRKGSLFWGGGLNCILSAFYPSSLPMWARQCFYQSLWGNTKFRWWQSSMRTFLDTELLVLPTCLYPGTALYLKLCLWSEDQPLEHTTHPLLCYIAKDQPEWYVLCNQTPRRQEQLFLTVALSSSEPSLMPSL